MKIADVFVSEGIVYAVVTGDDIRKEFRCKAIRAENGVFNVTSVKVVRSFIGEYQAVLAIEGQNRPDTGSAVAMN